MKISKAIIVMVAAMAATVGNAGDSAPFRLDTRTSPLVDSLPVSWNAEWIGGDTNATVVISDNGTELRRATGAGEFTYTPSPSGLCRHDLTYTTYIGGVAQEETYLATIYAQWTQWKYEVADGGAVITETTQTSGAIAIPSEIDGYPVTGIDNGVFAGCSNPTSVTIPDSVTSIGNGAFSGCTGVTNVTMPGKLLRGVVLIGTLTTNGWTLLSKDSDGTEEYQSASIGHSASTFMTLTLAGPCDLTFGWKVSSESGYDYLRWYLDGTEKAKISGTGGTWQNVSVSVPTGEHTIKWTYSKDGSDSAGSDCGWVRVPPLTRGATAANLFPDFCTNLQSVTLTGVVTEIPDHAFDGCTALTAMEIPSTVTNIGAAAFAGCTALASVYVASGDADRIRGLMVDSGFDVSGVTFAEVDNGSDGWLYEVVGGTATVTGCVSAVGDIEVPSVLGGYPVTAVGTAAFSNKVGLTSVIIPDGVTSIGTNAFYGCSGLTGVAIPNSVTNIGSQAFCTCSRLEWVTLPDGLTDIAGNLFRNCGRLAGVVIPDSVTNITSGAFRYCYGLESVVIGSGVVRIGNKSFGNCTNLVSVVIPDSVTYIAGSAFEKCRRLSDVTVGRGVATIYIGAFSDCSSLTNLLFLGNAPGIGNNAFTNVAPGCCAHVRYASTGWGVDIPGTWKGIAIDYVHHSVTFDANGGEGGGTAWVADGPGLAPLAAARRNYRLVGWFTAAEGGDEVTAETPITADMTLYAHWELLSATWLYKVVGGTAAVTGCVSAVGNIEVPSVIDDYTVTVIGENAFSGKLALTGVTIPNSVTNIGAYAFSNCTYLTSVTLPASVTGIGGDAFRRCTRLESVTLPDSLSAIDANVFRDCSKLERVDLGNGVESIGNKAFSKCTNLTSVAILGNVKVIDVAAFEYCSGLTNVTIGAGVTDIGKVAFQYCSALKSILFNGNAPTTVAANAFTTGVAPDCCAYVYRASTGWGVEIPGPWKGIAIAYRSETDGIVVDAGGGKSVTVPSGWITDHSVLVEAAGGDAATALAATAANGRKVWECYVLGLDPEDNSATNDFKITSFPLKADGTPDVEHIIFDPPQAKWNVPATYKVKGAAELSGPWQEVGGGLGEAALPEGFRFFKVEVVLP